MGQLIGTSLQAGRDEVERSCLPWEARDRHRLRRMNEDAQVG